MNTTRTDIHRPAEMVSTDYRLIAFLEPFAIDDADGNTVTELETIVVDEEAWSRYEAGELAHWPETKNAKPLEAHRCDHCGAHFKYACWYLHEPSGKVIAVGRDCSAKRFGATDWEYLANRARVASHYKNGLEILRGMGEDGERIAEYLAGATRLMPYRWARSEYDGTFGLVFDFAAAPEATRGNGLFVADSEFKAHRIACDAAYQAGVEPIAMTYDETKRARSMSYHRDRIAGAEASLYALPRRSSKAVLDGEEPVSIEEYLAAIDKLEEAREALRADVLATAPKQVGDAPDGRQTVVGTVVAIKWVESQYGSTEKMIVELPNGARVFGTVPSSIRVDHGSRVEFSGDFEPSHNDKSFGFFKRPTKARLLTESEVAA